MSVPEKIDDEVKMHEAQRHYYIFVLQSKVYCRTASNMAFEDNIRVAKSAVNEIPKPVTPCSHAPVPFVSCLLHSRKRREGSLLE